MQNYRKITLCQIPATPLAGAEKLAFLRSNSGLKVFPELCLSGYPAADFWLHPQIIQDIAAQAQKMAQHLSAGQGVLVGAPWVVDGRLYNAALLLADGQVQIAALKQHPPNYGVFDEKRYFTPAERLSPIEWQGRRLGVLICEDMWYAAPAAQAKAAGAEMLLVMNASPFDRTKRHQRLFHARARVQASGLPLAYVNYAGGQDDLVFDGGSFVLNAAGEIMTMAGTAPGELAVDFAAAALSDAGYTHIDDTLIKNLLVMAIRDYVRGNGFEKILLGLSGGIDSALVLCLAAEALGAQNVTAISLPYHYTSDASRQDAEILAKALGVTLHEIPIAQPVHVFHHLLESHIPQLADLAWQNLQSRTRGLILMALSNAQNALLLTTGNKSELAVGYSTLYGDMSGAFNPLKDLYKTEVYALAHTCYESIIPQRIFMRPPSAELKPDQTDQDTLPPYEILDAILQRLIEGYQSVDEVVAAGFDRTVTAKVARMLRVAEYKRYQSPPGPKMTARSFGREWRYPLTHKIIM